MPPFGTDDPLLGSWLMDYYLDLRPTLYLES